MRDVRLASSVGHAPGPYAGLWQAAAQVATPHLRNMGTLGGNLCLDTRCNYYDQNYEWRKAIDFCMKKDGETCWVATSSPKCLAVSSTDTAPALLALGAEVTLVSAERHAPDRAVAISISNDGIHYLTRQPNEILTVDPRAAARRLAQHLLEAAAARRVRLSGAVGRRRGEARGRRHGRSGAHRARRRRVAPDRSAGRSRGAVGRPLTDEVIADAAELAAQPAKPMDNTDFSLLWRKRVTRDFVTYALRELRGDDMREVRRTASALSDVALRIRERSR